MTWTPSPTLAATVRRALAAMHAFYPRTLAPALETSEAAESWITSYCRAFLPGHVSLAAISEAAIRWPAEKGKQTPYPAEFAALAVEIERELHPRPDPPRPTSAVPDLPSRAVEARSQEAYDALHTPTTPHPWRLVSAVWTLAWSVATTEAMRTDVREGTIPRENWHDLIARVQRGERAPSPPALPVRDSIRDVIRGALA